MNILFAGTPAFAARHLRALLENDALQVGQVFTQPDRPAGRGRALRPSPVKELAANCGIEVHQPERLGEREAHIVANGGFDCLVVVAYGLILPPALLAAPPLGCVNVHASLLPRWRGAAPIQRALAAGDKVTGISIMRMDEGLDTGPLLAGESLQIEGHDTAGSLHDRLAEQGARLLPETLLRLARGELKERAQDPAQASYAEKIRPSEARLDFGGDAYTLERLMRAFDPVPGAWGLVDGVRVKLWRALPRRLTSPTPAQPGSILAVGAAGIDVACGERDLLRLTQVQLPGKRRMAARALANARSHPLRAGRRFEPASA